MRYAVIAATLLVGGWGCDPFADFDVDDPDSRRCSGTDQVVEGTWVLSGEGRREGCIDENLNTDAFELRSLPIPVRQVDDALLLDDDGLPGSFRLESARVRGSCVDFTSVERFDGDTLSIEWRGEVEGDRVVGSFEGTGPDGCRSEGNFQLRIDP
jgi:hypothetical protein